jgi:hypothetical protein
MQYDSLEPGLAGVPIFRGKKGRKSLPLTGSFREVTQTTLDWALEHVSEEARPEFMEDLSKAAYRLSQDPSEELTRQVQRMLEQWIVSIRLANDPTWQRNMAASTDSALADHGRLVSVDNLGRELVS